MDLVQTARDTLKAIPMADVLRERLSLALDQYAEAERKVAALQKENGRMEAELHRVEKDNRDAQQQLETLRELHKEDVCVRRGAEFRRGKRTLYQWEPFCPACHLPAISHGGDLLDCSAACGWSSNIPPDELPQIIREIDDKFR